MLAYTGAISSMFCNGLHKLTVDVKFLYNKVLKGYIDILVVAISTNRCKSLGRRAAIDRLIGVSKSISIGVDVVDLTKIFVNVSIAVVVEIIADLFSAGKGEGRSIIMNS